MSPRCAAHLFFPLSPLIFHLSVRTWSFEKYVWDLVQGGHVVGHARSPFVEMEVLQHSREREEKTLEYRRSRRCRIAAIIIIMIIIVIRFFCTFFLRVREMIYSFLASLLFATKNLSHGGHTRPFHPSIEATSGHFEATSGHFVLQLRSHSWRDIRSVSLLGAVGSAASAAAAAATVTSVSVAAVSVSTGAMMMMVIAVASMMVIIAIRAAAAGAATAIISP
jgi:hypothetical protein